jgi:hypothetical protein
VVWIDCDWAAIIPEPVLRDWFGAVTRPDEAPTLYATLGLKADVTDLTIRSAYRRLARQWHPDVCKEPDAAEQFLTIQHAYEVLREPNTRARYDAGLALAANAQEQAANVQRWEAALAPVFQNGYRSPLRCGLIMAQGEQRGRWFIVSGILAWEDVTDARGRILVTSWPMGANEPWEVWQ